MRPTATPVVNVSNLPPHAASPCRLLTALEVYDYVFSENGLVAHKAGKLLAVQSLKVHLGEDKLKK
jgi:hypothetical protein